METAPIAPSYIIVPSKAPASTFANATVGTLVVSGAFLYYHNGTGWAMVSGAVIS